jgi:hypothetical protein
MTGLTQEKIWPPCRYLEDVQLALSYCFCGFILTVQQLYTWVVANQNNFKMYLILTKYCNWSFSPIQAVWFFQWSDFSILNRTGYCGFLFTWEHLFSPFGNKMQEKIAQEVCIQDFTVLWRTPRRERLIGVETRDHHMSTFICHLIYVHSLVTRVIKYGVLSIFYEIFENK